MVSGQQQKEAGMGDDEILDGAEIDEDYDSGAAEEQGNAGEDTADAAGAG